MAIVFIRTIIIFLSLLVSMRIMGKRQMGELELNELVVTVLIADMAALPLQDISIPLSYGLIPLAVLLCCELLFSALIVHSPKARSLLCGRPSIIIANGVINQKEMRKNRFTLDELAEELRTHDITDISKVQYAILETDGQLNTMLFAGEQPPTASQLNIKVKDTGYTSIIINNGKVMKDNLAVMNHDEGWLNEEIKKRGIKSSDSVYLFSVNHSGEIYCVEKEK